MTAADDRARLASATSSSSAPEFGGLGMGMPLKRRRPTTTSCIVEQDRRRRRHLAGQPLSRRGLRHPVAACIRSPSRPTRTGRAAIPHSRRSRPTCRPACERFGLGPHLRLHTRLIHLHWDEAHAALWRARVLERAARSMQWLGPHRRQLATGPTEPAGDAAAARPRALPGPVIHTARWQAEVFDATGRRIGVDRHRRQRDPADPAARASGAATHRVPAQRRRGCCRAATRRSAPALRWLLQHVPPLRRPGVPAIYARHELRAPAFTASRAG